jgi:hypothetical protein
MKLEDHPTVQRMHLKTVPSVPPKKESLDAGWLKQLVLDAGADDVGFVEIGRPALDDQRQGIFKAFPHTKTLISLAVYPVAADKYFGPLPSSLRGVNQRVINARIGFSEPRTPLLASSWTHLARVIPRWSGSAAA